MALAEAILVCLAEEPLTGYELAKSFDTSSGFFWRADHQQIYRELKRLRENDWVSDELVVQQGRPNKRRYSITAAGRAHLMEWSQQSQTPPPIKDDLLVKLYSLADVDAMAVREQIADRLAGHRDRRDQRSHLGGTNSDTLKQVGFDRANKRHQAERGHHDRCQRGHYDRWAQAS